MPIYAYRCSACGFAQDVLQKVGAQPLTECPQCKTAHFVKQLTAPGFQLKGSGWYATDFKGGTPAPADQNKPKADANPPPCQGGTGSCPACPSASA
jgi:putative FmdB family regulatory protein